MTAFPVPDDDLVQVRAHQGLCEGWGNCHRFAPDVYPLDDDGCIAVHLLEVPAGLARAAWIGASACPERAITVVRRGAAAVASAPTASRPAKSRGVSADPVS